ncbi:DUF3800 domain-containing protein [Brevibacillus reuszeri]|uniref:DUF3800 domain-containing protein n=1 Tax=Brevibacillus reuszeri TaxID=54915 RepID=UPI00366D9A2D
MDLVYLDESGDVIYTKEKGTRNFVLSAFIVPEESWNAVFEIIKSFRQYLKKEYGIPMYKELHARDFLNGRGRPSKTKTLTKFERVEITRVFLRGLAKKLPEHGVYIINVCVPNKEGENNYDVGVDRIFNRIERTLKARGRKGILIFDQGKEHLVTRISRKMRIFNPIPSRFGVWLDDGQMTKNITTENIVGDPFFRDSAEDYFIQTIDFVAFLLLKNFEPPTEHVKKYNIMDLFPILEPILYKPASKYHPLGIVTK